jgi:hypothetical protein
MALPRASTQGSAARGSTAATALVEVVQIAAPAASSASAPRDPALAPPPQVVPAPVAASHAHDVVAQSASKARAPLWKAAPSLRRTAQGPDVVAKPAQEPLAAASPEEALATPPPGEPLAAPHPGERLAEPPPGERLAAPPPEDTLAAEVAALSQARTALHAGDAVRSLAILDGYAALHPRGTLREERLATRILALCALGKIEAARAGAQSLARLAPSSPQWVAIDTSCAGRVAPPDR